MALQHPGGDGAALVTSCSGHRRVLVVDDDAALRGMVADTLAETGWHSLTASNGAEALDVLSREAVDVLLLDLTMPHLNGVGVLALLNRRERQPPVILMSASRGSREEALRLGAVDFLLKPFTLTTLLASLERATR